MIAWADDRQAWLDAQNFDPCVRKAYQGWINHVRGYQVREATRDLRKREAVERVQQRPEFKNVVR